MDFSEIQFAVIFDWNSMEDEAIYIIPVLTNSENDIENISSIENANKTIYQQNVVQTTSGDIKVDISLLYDNAYSECFLNAGEELTAEVEIKNTNETSSTDVSVMIALYDENSRLIGIQMTSENISANATAELKPTIVVPADNTATRAKVMVWNSTNMHPYTNALTLTVAGEDFFGDNYNLAVNMDNRNTANGMINSESDFDVFEFKALKDGLYTFESYGATDTYATLTSKSTPTEVIKSDDNSGADNNFRLSATLQEGNSYYLKVAGHNVGKYKIVSNYAIGNVFGTVSPVKSTDDFEYSSLIESKCSLYTFDSNEFVAQMHLQEYTEQNNEYANFSLVGVSAGEYLVKISRPGYLSRYSKIALNDDVVDLGNKILIAGDVNDDGVIDLNDSTLLSSALNSNYGDDNYNIMADFNGDKMINSVDEGILNNNIGKTSNDYDENVDYILFDVSVNNYNASIIGKSKANSVVLCSVFRGDIFVGEYEITCDDDGDFSATTELSQNGTYSFIVTSDNRAFDAVKTLECN